MLRVKGLVALERRVREQLRSGIPRAELARFRRAVSGTVASIGAVLARHGLPPEALPAPTRNAYRFLQALDLDDLPTRDGPAPGGPSLVGISNVTGSSRWVAANLAALAAQPGPQAERRAAVVARIDRAVSAVERICAEHGASPSLLKAPTRRAYGWLKFLSAPANLERHLDAISRALAIARRLVGPADGRAPAVVVEFAHTASVWRCERRGGRLSIRIAEGLIAADDAVLEAVLTAALLGERDAHRKRYLDFAETDAYRDVLLEIDLAADVDADQPQGVVYDLRELFEVVNARYLGGTMSPPRLAWSDRLTSRRLGYFEPQRDRIVVSRTLDAERVPRFVVEYIVYHELLHRKLGTTWSGSRMRSHTAQFRREERRFAQHREAEEWMRGNY